MNGLPSIGGYSASGFAVGNAQEMLRGQDYQERAREARAVNEVLDGCFGHQVEASLRHRYHSETFAQLKMQHGIQTHNRLLNDVLGKVCVAFAGGAKYSLKRESQELQDDAFDAFLDVADYDNLLKMLDTLTECHRGVWVMPAVHDDGASGMRRFHHVVLTPEWFNLIPAEDDPTTYVQLDVYSEEWSSDGRRCEKYKDSWSVDEVVKYKMSNAGWVMVDAPKANPYGIIPGVLFRRNKPLTTLWSDVPGPMLAQKTVEANCWETMVSYQGSGQVKFLAGEFKNWPQGQVLRHAGVVDTGGGSPSVLDLQTDVAGFVATFISRLRNDAAVALGLGADEFSASGQPPSGEALKMRYWARDRYAMGKRSFMVADLKKLYADTLVVLDVHMRMVRDDDAAEEVEPAALQPIIGIDALPPLDAALSVDPSEVTYPELATERQTQDDWDLQHNLTNLAILARDRNPDLDDDGAKAFVLANKEANAAMGAAPKPSAPPSPPGKVPLMQRVAQMRAGNKPPPPTTSEPGA